MSSGEDTASTSGVVVIRESSSSSLRPCEVVDDPPLLGSFSVERNKVKKKTPNLLGSSLFGLD